MAEEKQVELKTGKNINGETMFQLNFDFKTLIIIIGFILTTVSGAWLDLKIRIDNAGEDAQTEIAKFDSDIKEIKNGVNELKDVDIRSVADRLNLVDGKVQGLIVILQSSNRTSHPTNTTPSNSHNPTTPVIP